MIFRSFIVLLLLSQLFFQSVTHAQEKLIESVVAVVNDKPILLSEFEQAWQIRKQQFNGNISNEGALKQRLIEHLIIQQLQKESAQQNGIRVSERELNASIDIIAKNNRLSLRELYNQAAAQGLSIQAFRGNIRQQLIAQRLQQQLFANRIKVSDIEIDEVLARENQLNDPMEYQYQTLLIQPDNNNETAWDDAKNKINQIREAIALGQSFNEAIALYSANNDGFAGQQLSWQDSTTMPDIFHKILLKLDNDELSSPIKTGRGYFLLRLVDKQFKQKVQGFEYKLAQISLPLGSYNEQEISEIEKEVKQSLQENKTSFTQLAKKYSKDRFAKSGGETEWLKPNDIDPTLAYQLDSQEISDQLHKVLTREGWVLYRLVDKKSYDASEELSRAQIRQRLTYLKVQEQYQEFLRNLRLRSAVQIHF